MDRSITSIDFFFGLLQSLDQLVAKGFSIVPIPNSGMAVGTTDNFPVIEQATALGKGCDNCWDVQPILRWKKPKAKSHNSSGSRSPYLYIDKLEVTEEPLLPVVLYDDMSTSGSQLLAAATVLKNAGAHVEYAVVLGRATKDHGIKKCRPHEFTLETADELFGPVDQDEMDLADSIVEEIHGKNWQDQ